MSWFFIIVSIFYQNMLVLYNIKFQLNWWEGCYFVSCYICCDNILFRNTKMWPTYGQTTFLLYRVGARI